MRLQELGVHFQSKYAVLVPGGNVSTKQLVRFVLADREDPTPATLVRQGIIVAPLLCKLRELKIQVLPSPSTPLDPSRPPPPLPRPRGAPSPASGGGGGEGGGPQNTRVSEGQRSVSDYSF